MAVLTATRDTDELASSFAMDMQLYTGVDSDVFYKGAMLMYDQNDSKIKPAAASTTSFGVGRCELQLTTGTSNTYKPKVRAGIFKYGNSASADEITAADIGNACYMVDDATVAKTDGSSTRSKAGKVVAVDSDGVWVAFLPLNMA